jgi:hypothetical protein
MIVNMRPQDLNVPETQNLSPRSGYCSSQAGDRLLPAAIQELRLVPPGLCEGLVEYPPAAEAEHQRMMIAGPRRQSTCFSGFEPYKELRSLGVLLTGFAKDFG